MAIYQSRARSTIVTGTAMAALWAFRGSTNNRARIHEIQLFAITAPTTSGAIGICRSTALGTGALTSVLGLPRDTGEPASTAQIVTAWATLAPTVGTVATVFHSFACGPTIGNGVIWTFDREPLIIPLGSAATGELVFVNLQATAPGTWDVVVIYEE